MNYQKQTQAHNIEKITTHSLSFHTHQSHTHGTCWRTRIADKDERFFSGNAQIDIMTTKRPNDWPSRRGERERAREGGCVIIEPARIISNRSQKFAMILCGFKEPKIERDEEGKGGEKREKEGVEGGYRASKLAISAHSQLIIIIISCCVRSWHPAKDS